MELTNASNLEAALRAESERILRQREQYDRMISDWIFVIEASAMSTKQKQQKILELHHLAALVISMEEQGIISGAKEISLLDLVEEPDFILQYKAEKIGLELRRVVNEKAELYGMQRGMLRKAEKVFKQDHPGINLLANVSFQDKYDWKTKSIGKVRQEISDYVYCLYSGLFMEKPEYIDRARISTHTGLNLELSGTYWVGEMGFEQILAEVNAKEKKIDVYLSNHDTLTAVWLLLIISGASPESDFRLPDLSGLSLQSKFRKVFLLNDFKKKVYVLK